MNFVYVWPKIIRGIVLKLFYNGSKCLDFMTGGVSVV